MELAITQVVKFVLLAFLLFVAIAIIIMLATGGTDLINKVIGA